MGAGLSWREAAWILRAPRVLVPRSAPAPSGEPFVARAEFEHDDGGAREVRPRAAVYAGLLDDIALAARREVES